MKKIVGFLILVFLGSLPVNAVQIICYVDPDAGGAGTGVDWNNAYTSGAAWNKAEATNLVTDGNYHTVYFRSSGATEDTSFTVGTGWTTGPNNYIELIQVDFPADGIIDLTKYRAHNLNTTSPALTIAEDYVRVHNMQLIGTKTTSLTQRGVGVSITAVGTSDIRLDSCIIKRYGTASGGVYGLLINDADAVVKVYNTTILDWGQGSGQSGISIGNASDVQILNCTIYGANIGISRTAGTVTAKNCAVGNCVDDFGPNITIDYCCSDDGDGDHPQNPVDGDWANEFNDIAGGDYSLKTGGNCIGNGMDNPGAGLYSDDIIGTVRSSVWDIGAFEYMAAGPPIAAPIIYMFDF